MTPTIDRCLHRARRTAGAFRLIAASAVGLVMLASGASHAQPARFQQEPSLDHLIRYPQMYALNMDEPPPGVDRARRFLRDLEVYRDAVDWRTSYRILLATGQYIERCEPDGFTSGMERLEGRLATLRRLHAYLERSENSFNAWHDAFGVLQEALVEYMRDQYDFYDTNSPIQWPEGTVLPHLGPNVPPPVKIVDGVATILLILPRSVWEMERRIDEMHNLIARSEILYAWSSALLLARDEARDLKQWAADEIAELEQGIVRLRSAFSEHECERQCVILAEIDGWGDNRELVEISHPRPTGLATRHAVVERLLGSD